MVITEVGSQVEASGAESVVDWLQQRLDEAYAHGSSYPSYIKLSVDLW